METYLAAQLALAIFNVGNAAFDAHRIKANKRIYHGLNLAAYAIWIALLSWLCGWNPVVIVLFAISAFCNRQLSFDIPLNLIRDLPWDYVSPAKPPKSITDRIEIFLFGHNGKVPVIVYGLLWLAIGNIVINYIT